jgi:SAM-dependent methyltransferase
MRRFLPHRVIFDRELRLGEAQAPVVYSHLLVKEQVARRHLLGGPRPGRRLRFLDIGAGDGNLDYLLSVDRNHRRLPPADEQRFREEFARRYEYVGLELQSSTPGVLSADICSEAFAGSFPELGASFHAIYSNNVFEHLRRPWIAARNIVWLLQPGGVCVTIAPFSIRYHEVPGDFFRYTHTGLAALFEDSGPVRVVESGYDTTGRRNDWQGVGTARDTVPTDGFGAWRENWFSVVVIEKTGDLFVQGGDPPRPAPQPPEQP